MTTGQKVVVVSMLAVAVAIVLFLIYQFTAFYHYKSVVLDRFPIEPPTREEKRFYQIEQERKDQAIELAKRHAKEREKIYGDIQHLAEKIKGELKILGWQAERAIHMGDLYDEERFGQKVAEDFRASMERIKRGLVKLKDLGVMVEGSPAYELMLEADPKYFAQRVRRLREEYVSIQFYLLPRGRGFVQAKDLSEQSKKTIDEIDREVEKATSIMKHFYNYPDSLYLVSFRYQTQEDILKDRTRGWYFEVDLDSKVVRDILPDRDLSRKYRITEISKR